MILSNTFRFFIPELGVTKMQGHLPHWDQEGATYFITWRTADSIPKEVWLQWRKERGQWLIAHGINPDSTDWRKHLEQLPEAERLEFARAFTAKLEAHMDDCHGDCLLKLAELAKIVSDALRFFDGDRYLLGDFVVMPNHVHLLVGHIARNAMLKQVESWKTWTAREINKRANREGRFWQDESFDHLVRSPGAFDKFRRYIAENPAKAKLNEGEYSYWRRPD